MTTVRCLTRLADPADGTALGEETLEIEDLPGRLQRRSAPALWLDLPPGDEEALRGVTGALGIGPRELEGILGAHARPKALRHHDHVAFVVVAPVAVGSAALAARGEDPDAPEEDAPQPERGEEQFRAVRLAGFVHPGGVVTVRSDAAFDLDGVRESWSAEEAAGLGGAGLAHLILDEVVDAQFWVAQWIDDRLDDLEDRVFAAGGHGGGIEQIAAALRTELTGLRRVVQPMAGVLERLRADGDAATAPAPAPNRASTTTPTPTPPSAAASSAATSAGRPAGTSVPPPGAGSAASAAPSAGSPAGASAEPSRSAEPSGVLELQALHASLVDHVLRAQEWTDSQHETLNGVVQTHLALQDQHLNVVMRRLAGWAAVISIPTLVTGWFGINVPYPGTGSVSGLIAAVVLVIVPTAVVGILLRRARWI